VERTLHRDATLDELAASVARPTDAEARLSWYGSFPFFDYDPEPADDEDEDEIARDDEDRLRLRRIA